MSEYPVVLIDWIDAQHHEGWVPVESARRRADDTESMATRTVGFLIAKTRKGVVVAMNLSESDGDGVADTMTIPASCVRRIRVIHKAK